MEEMRKGGREDGSNGRKEERGKTTMEKGRTGEIEEGRKGVGGMEAGRKGVGGMEAGRKGERMGGMEEGRMRGKGDWRNGRRADGRKR